MLVKDFEKSLPFYRDILGLELNSQDGKFADFKLEGTSLAIFQKSDAVAMFPEKFMTKGLLSLVMPHFFEIKLLTNVSKTLFYPLPKINSKVLEIKHKKLNEKEKTLLNIYLQSDKKLKNVFDNDLSFKDKRIYQLNFDEWKEIVNALGL